MEIRIAIFIVIIIYLSYKVLDYKLRLEGLLWWMIVEKKCTLPDENELVKCAVKSIQHDIRNFKFKLKLRR